MITKIADYILDWNYESKKGTIVLVFENRHSEAIKELEHLDFLVIKSVLKKGNSHIDFNNKTIFNKK